VWLVFDHDYYIIHGLNYDDDDCNADINSLDNWYRLSDRHVRQ
jgi:hypothetical protein